MYEDFFVKEFNKKLLNFCIEEKFEEAQNYAYYNNLEISIEELKEMKSDYEKRKEDEYERGRRAEREFKELLNKAYIPYVYFEQSPTTFSAFFKEIELKRPDFLIVFRTGIVGLDVKSKDVDKEKYDSILMNEIDIEKLNNFERYFRIPIWYAITIKSDNYKIWYFCNLNQLIKLEIKRNPDGGEPYRLIPFADCIKITIDDKTGFGQLLI